MIVKTDNAAWRVHFIWRGDDSYRLPIDVRPGTLVQSVFVGFLSTFVWAAIWAVPWSLAAPGPVGILCTAGTAILFAIITTLVVGSVLAKVNTPDKPLPHNVRTFLSDLRAQRPAKERTDNTVNLDTLWASNRPSEMITISTIFTDQEAPR